VAFQGITEASYPGKDCGLTSVGMYLFYCDSGTTSSRSQQRGGKGHNCNSNHDDLGDCFFHIVLLRHIVIGANSSLLPGAKLDAHRSKPCAILVVGLSIRITLCNYTTTVSEELRGVRCRYWLFNALPGRKNRLFSVLPQENSGLLRGCTLKCNVHIIMCMLA